MLLFYSFFQATGNAQIKDPKATEVWEPVPRKVIPGKNGGAPSDAIVLFDGTNLNEWKSKRDGSAAKWKIENDYLEVVKGTGDIMTNRKFGDIQLHIEWSTPTEIVGEGQKEEIQVFSFKRNTKCKC